MGRKYGFFGPDKKKNEAHAQQMAAMENQMVMAQSTFDRQVAAQSEQARIHQAALNSHFAEQQKALDAQKAKMTRPRNNKAMFGDDEYDFSGVLGNHLGGK